MRQIHIFLKVSKEIQQFVWLFTCFVRIVDLKLFFVLICTLAEQFHVHKSYKMRESTLSCIGNFEENIDLSHIYLAVPFLEFWQDILIYLSFFQVKSLKFATEAAITILRIDDLIKLEPERGEENAYQQAYQSGQLDG